MPGETFKRFAIYASSYCGVTYGYTLLADMEKRTLVYRDTYARSRFEGLAGITLEVDTARAYARAAAERQGKEFTRVFELSDEDIAKIAPLLSVDGFAKAKEKAESFDPIKEGMWVIDDRIGLDLGFEGYTGSSTPLFQVKNAYDNWLGIPQLEELHHYLMDRFKLWRMPGAGMTNETPRSKHNKKKHRA